MCPSVSGECRWDRSWLGFEQRVIESGLESGWEMTEGVGRIRRQGGHLILLPLGRRSLGWLLGSSTA